MEQVYYKLSLPAVENRLFLFPAGTHLATEILFANLPILAVMVVLMLISAFFAVAESSFFSLTREDRRKLAESGKVGQAALKLAGKADTLLNIILLGNLIVNMLTFTLSTVITFRLQKSGHSEFAGTFALGTLLTVIIFCEVLPKSIGVIAQRYFAVLCTIPLMLFVRFLNPVLPVLMKVNILSRRLFCPNLRPEPFLLVADLERAVEMSKDDAALLKREQRVLQNIVSISDIRAEELMRPRTLLNLFRKDMPFDGILETMHGDIPKSGYCIFTEPDTGEITAALNLTRFTPEMKENLPGHCEPLVYIPWSTSVAEVFGELNKADSGIAAVVNEYGESIGVLTMDDILETIFTREKGRSRRLLNRLELERINPYTWEVNELTGLRILQRKLGLDTAGYYSTTVGGLLREILERFPRQGDCCSCGTFEFRVTEQSPEGNDLVIYMRKLIQ
jgi:CBS domain containing-hemolysin-like protein